MSHISRALTLPGLPHVYALIDAAGRDLKRLGRVLLLTMFARPNEAQTQMYATAYFAPALSEAARRILIQRVHDNRMVVMSEGPRDPVVEMIMAVCREMVAAHGYYIGFAVAASLLPDGYTLHCWFPPGFPQAAKEEVLKSFACPDDILHAAPDSPQNISLANAPASIQ